MHCPQSVSPSEDEYIQDGAKATHRGVLNFVYFYLTCRKGVNLVNILRELPLAHPSGPIPRVTSILQVSDRAPHRIASTRSSAFRALQQSAIFLCLLKWKYLVLT